MSLTQEQAESAADYIRDHANEYAKAKANRIQLENYLKTERATLFLEAPQGSVADREAYAYAHMDYAKVIEGLGTAVQEEEKIRWLMKAAELKIEIWRTQEANSRRG